MQQREQENNAVGSFMTIGTLYSYLYCMLASNVLLSMPVLGGALGWIVTAALLLRPPMGSVPSITPQRPTERWWILESAKVAPRR